MNLNRREMLASLMASPVVAVSSFLPAKEPQQLQMKSYYLEASTRPQMNMTGVETGVETDFLVSRNPNNPKPLFRNTFAVFVDGRFIERYVYANCLTGEVHFYTEQPEDMHPLASPLMTCLVGRKVQIMFRNNAERQEYMEEMKTRPNGLMPLSDGTSNSPERQYLERRFGNA